MFRGVVLVRLPCMICPTPRCPIPALPSPPYVPVVAVIGGGGSFRIPSRYTIRTPVLLWQTTCIAPESSHSMATHIYHL
jgi:hypothetical protein